MEKPQETPREPAHTDNSLGWLADGEKIVDLCERGDELVEKKLSTGRCNASLSSNVPSWIEQN